MTKTGNFSPDSFAGPGSFLEELLIFLYAVPATSRGINSQEG
jgi:hypothetical protein